MGAGSVVAGRGARGGAWRTRCCSSFCTPRWWRSCGPRTQALARGERRRACRSWRAWASAWARLWARGCPGRRWPLERSWMLSSSCAKTCGLPCSKSTWTDSAPTTRGPMCCRTTASPSSSPWARGHSIWRKLPSSWPSPAAFCAAPSIRWASRAWSPPLWLPCPPVSSRW